MTSKRFTILGILNATPDSFSDGGDYFSTSLAIKKAVELSKQGADYIDIGAESTRPGSKPLDEATEWQRLSPIIKALKENYPNIKLSIDTYKPELMLKAAKLGVDMINSIKGVGEKSHLEQLLKINNKIKYIAMHMHGNPETMQEQPLDYGSSFLDEFCSYSTQALKSAGFIEDQIWLDPGIGFGKSDRVNHSCLEWCSNTKFKNIALGLSRKSYIGRMFNIGEAKQRDDVSNAIEYGITLAHNNVNLIRTHRVEVLAGLRELRKSC